MQHTHMPRWWGRCAAVVVALAWTIPAHADFAVHGQVVAAGADAGAGAAYRTLGTVGQPAVGVSAKLYRMVCSGFWCFGGARVVAVDDGPDGGPPGSDLPAELALGPPAPNPSRGAVRFTLALPEEATVTLAVFDVAGRQLGDPVSQHFGAGWHALEWSAPAGRSGVYFGRLIVEGRVRAERRLVLVR